MPTPTYPKALKKGDKIGVFAPSSYVLKEEIEKSKKHLEEFGFEVFIHPQTYERLNQSAGKPDFKDFKYENTGFL